MYRELIHYGIHFLLPIAVGILAFPQYRWKAVLILLAGILLDVDHLLADPVFDPNRCSIGFHPLHSYWAIGIYMILLFPRKTRIWGLAFMIHMLADSVDCLLI